MKRLFPVAALAALLAASGLGAIIGADLVHPREAYAADAAVPAFVNGAVTLAAATPKKIPTSSLVGRHTIGICNTDSAAFYLCSASAGCDDTTGLPVFPSTCTGLDLGFSQGVSGGQQQPGAATTIGQVWAYSAAGGTKIVRYAELR